MAEEALRRSEERLRVATEATGLGIYDLDAKTGQADWTDELCALFGIPAGTPGNREAFASVLHPGDRDWLFREHDDAALHRKTGHTAKFRIVRADNSHTRWLSGTTRFFYDDAGDLARTVGTLRDITREKEAELALRESEVRYRILAENATDVIFRTGLDGRRLYLSPSVRDVYGYEADELVGTAASDLIHPDDVSKMRTDLEGTIAGKSGHETTVYRIRHKAGRWVWLEARRRLVRDQHGAPVEVVGIVRDITARLRLEEQLRQAQKMEAVGQLTGGVAHDFNNLLTVVIGNAELLADELHEPQHKELAVMALEAAERGAHLTRQLLSFARRQSLKLEALRLDQVVEGMLPLLKRTLGETIEIATRTAERHSNILADRGLLESALLNLALNARDAMEHGGTLTLKTGERVATEDDGSITPGQPVAYVTLSDTGAGMPPEVLARAFEPFFTTKDVGKGSGLGLPMVHGFAEQSGGHVSIESLVGEGTAVTVVLPVVASDTTGAETDGGTTRREPIAAKRSVLLVEDEPQVLQFVTQQLISLGYEVTAVPNARDALRLLQQGRCFDLLFTDIVLPQGMSGVELAREASTTCPELKILLTSGYPQDAFDRYGRPPEGVPLLRKPYRRKDLFEALERALGSPAS
jgi:PAS domain S-box-containing protein